MSTKTTDVKRTYHNSHRTDEVLSFLPGWMKMKDPDSVGYQFINALIGEAVETIGEEITKVGYSFLAPTTHQNEPYIVYKTIHDTTDGNIPFITPITGYISVDIGHSIPSGTLDPSGNSSIILINVDDEERFFSYPTTRLTYDSDDDVEVVSSGIIITGISFIKDYSTVDTDGNILIPKQNVFIVNIDEESPVSSSGNTLIYDSEWNLLDGDDYGIGYQDYLHNLSYEIIEPVTGYELQYSPIASSVIVYDYINVDASGNAQVISDTYYTITNDTDDYTKTSTIVMSGENPYNGLPIENSNYFIEYDYLKFEYPKCVTTDRTVWHNQKLESPLFTSVPVNYYGTIVEHESAETSSTTHRLLRVSPLDVRPGNVVDVAFEYIAVSDVIWNADDTFINDLSSDANYTSLEASGAFVYHDGINISYDFIPEASGSNIVIPVGSSIYDPPYTVRMFYSAGKTYDNIEVIQSYESDIGIDDPYPNDYTIDNGYLIPYSIIPLSDTLDSVQDYLINSQGSQFVVTCDLSFNGTAYDRNKDLLWMIESNNLVLYKMSIDGNIMNRYNIFKEPNYYMPDKKSIASGIIDSNNNIIEYPLMSQEVDVPNRTAAGCVYYKDFLYIVSEADYNEYLLSNNTPIGGTGIYRIDTYNERVMDVAYTINGEENPHFPLPITSDGNSVGTAINDISLDDDENFIVSEGNKIKKLMLHYDYTLIDSTDGVVRGTVYYREFYPSGVDVSGFDEMDELEE